jgi:hypothetical protein
MAWLVIMLLGIAPGGTLYVKRADAPLRAGPSKKAAVLKKLPVGTAVTWEGPGERDKTFHRVRVGERVGFLEQGELAPTDPTAAPMGDAGVLDMAAFAGAMTTPYDSCFRLPATDGGR